MNFEKKFDTYDENAHIQKSVADTLVEFLDEMGVSKEREVFEIGCGTGLFSKRFIKKFSPKKIILNPDTVSFVIINYLSQRIVNCV